ncbi:uncharacterized protein B4U80_10268 [Leptotrombidium deliense]|uniref:Uncharacterized protein n=1 Tax=Leptotrombidium deliense TaxID=299467 RepID=A0A443SNU3_9ACAR|nr:uncharacterized protein B4U80_10268 [Leptotrombidium deliense]
MKHAECMPRKILAIVLLAVFINFFYFYIRFTKNGKFFEELQLLTSHSTSYCRLPLDLDPFDATVRPFIVRIPEIKCTPPKREFAYKNILTFVDDDGVLQTKNTSFKFFCTFCEVRRNDSNEDKVTYGAKNMLPSSLDINSLQIDFLSVECYDDKNKTIYNNTHFHPSSVKPKKSTIYKPSVIVMVIESMSRINFLRFLHKTRKELESLPDVFYMKGFTKQDDNSYPNMVPFLTGLYKLTSFIPFFTS